jgi:hypothetical protein
MHANRAGQAAVVLSMLVAGAATAGADPVRVSVTTGPTLQQIDNRPCIIGDPSCHNPEGFDYTLIGPRMKSGTLSSPTYTVDQLRQIVGGDTFYVGLDLNQAMGQKKGAYELLSFTLAVDGSLLYSTGGATSLRPLSPGNGYSDASIGLFDLSGLSGSQTVVFTASFAGATAGREQFFLRPALNGTPGEMTPTPEPATMLLLGSGLAGVAALRRRRRAPSA